jgi:hypothetical protein
MKKLLKLGIGTILVWTITLVRWAFGICIVVLDALKEYINQTMLAVDVQGKPSARMEKRRNLKPQVLQSEPEGIIERPPESNEPPPKNVLHLRTITNTEAKTTPPSTPPKPPAPLPNTPQSKRALLVEAGWSIVNNNKKDGIAMLVNTNGEEMLVNTRTWDAIYTGKVEQK